MAKLAQPLAEALVERVFADPSAELRDLGALMEALGVEDPVKALAQTTLTQIDTRTADRMTWLMERYGPHPEIDRAIAGRLGIWAQEDHRAAAQWLSGLPKSATRDEGVSRFAQSVAYTEPESAVEWAQTITDDALRVEVLGKVHAAWERNDPDAAAVSRKKFEKE